MVAASTVVLLLVREPQQLEASGAASRTEALGVLKNLQTMFARPGKSGLYVLLGILFWFMAFNALETALSSFAVFTLGISPGLASIYAAAVTFSFILFSLPAGILAGRFGRRNTIQIGLVGLTVLFFAGFLFIQGTLSFLIVLVLAGALWALVNVNSLPLVYDYGDERRAGAYTGLYYFASQSAAILGPTLGGVLVDVLGDQYRWMWLFSAVFMALAVAVMSRVREPRRVLEARAAEL
jgi:MFS family permease